MNWAKTDAGQIDTQAQAFVPAQAQCESLLASPADMSTVDTQAFAPTEPMTPPEPRGIEDAPEVPPECVLAAASSPVATDLPHSPASLDHGAFAAALIQLISTELGLRGFMLTIAVEKARSNAELRSVAQRTIDQIRAHRGDAAAAAAQRTLDGA